MNKKKTIGERARVFRMEILGGKHAYPVKWTQAVFARICGVKPQTVSQWENPKIPDEWPSDESIDRLVDFFYEPCGLTRDWLKFGRGHPPHKAVKLLVYPKQAFFLPPPKKFHEGTTMSNDQISGDDERFFAVKDPSASGLIAPIFLASELPSGVLNMFKSKTIGHLDLPENLLQVHESVYAFRMPNDSAAPMCEAGQIVIINPTRPLESKRGVVLFKSDRTEFLVRQFIRSNPTHWMVRRWGDSPAEEKLLREQWPIAEFISDVRSV